MKNQDLPDSYPDDWTPEMIRQDIINSGINPEPTCWSDSGLSHCEIFGIRMTARMYPNGAYAAFARKMDEGELNYRERNDSHA